MVESQWLREGPKPVFAKEPQDAWKEDEEETGRGQIIQCLECHALCQAMWQNGFGAGSLKRWLTNTYISAISRKSRLGFQPVHVV